MSDRTDPEKKNDSVNSLLMTTSEILLWVSVQCFSVILLVLLSLYARPNGVCLRDSRLYIVIKQKKNTKISKNVIENHKGMDMAKIGEY